MLVEREELPVRCEHRRRGSQLEVERAAEQVPAGDDAYAKFAATARDLGSHYPGDPGVLAALLMNRVALATGDALFLPAGNLHAYLTGGGIELMANSDNVMRGGLTPKHIDVAELLTILDFEPGLTGLVEAVEETSGVWRYPTPAPEFALWRLDGLAHDAIAHGPGGDPVAALVLGPPAPLELLLVGGTPVVDGGELRTVDAATATREVRAARQRLVGPGLS